MVNFKHMNCSIDVSKVKLVLFNCFAGLRLECWMQCITELIIISDIATAGYLRLSCSPLLRGNLLLPHPFRGATYYPLFCQVCSLSWHMSLGWCTCKCQKEEQFLQDLYCSKPTPAVCREVGNLLPFIPWSITIWPIPNTERIGSKLGRLA